MPPRLTCPDHPTSLTAEQARSLALDLLTLADDLDGPRDDQAVTGAQVRLELDALRQQAESVERALALFLSGDD